MIRALLRRLLGIRSPSKELASSVASGFEEGWRQAEERDRLRGHPITLEEFLEEQRPFVEQMRRVRSLYFWALDDDDHDEGSGAS